MNSQINTKNARNQCSNPLRAFLAHVVGWLAMAALIVFCMPAIAQLDTGSMSGTITDSAGAVVRGARIVATQTATGTTYSTVSSSTGYYVIPSLRPGIYTMTATAPGFKVQQVQGIIVAVGGSTARDMALSVGATTQSITVTAGTVTLEKDSSEIDASIQPQQVRDLPLIVSGGFRSLSSLEYLVPGVVGFGQAGATNTMKINGGQEEGTDQLIDGITTNRQENGSASFDILAPSIEAVSEFHISLSGLPAELGRTTGGLANYHTRGGSNQYHGTVYDFLRNNVFDANSWFNNGYIALNGDTSAARKEYKRPSDTQNDYGFNLGGPVRIPHLYNGRDKTFFFFNWEQFRLGYGGAINSLLPTPAELGADGQYFDFSSTLGATPLGQSPCGETVYPGEIMDPQYENTQVPCRYAGFGQTVSGGPGSYTVSGMPTNKIPIARASSIAKNIVNTYLMPLAKQETNVSSTYNYTYVSKGVVNNTAYSFRIDQNLGARNKVWGFWSSRENTNSGGNSNLPPPIQTCCGTVNQLGKLFRAGWDWIITPTVVNTLTVGGNRSNNINQSKASQMGVDWDQKLGIANGFSNDFPVFEFNGNTFRSLGQQEDSTDVDNVVAVNELIHWQHGAHSFTLGAEGQYHQYSWVSHIGGTCSGNAGCLQFWDNQTASDENFWGQDGNSFAAFLVGEAGLLSNLNDLHAPRWITHYGAVFAQDNWKVRPNLTLNLGLRWSYDTPRHEAEGDTANLDPAKPSTMWPGAMGALVFAGKGPGRNGSVNETWGTVYKKDFAPRVGFAWTPPVLNQRFVVRGSGGVYYGPLVYADYGQGMVQGFTVQGNLFTADPLDGPPLDGGLAKLSTAPDLNPDQLDGQNTSVDYIAKGNGRPAMVESWTLENQFQITPNLFATVGYLGMHSTRLHAMLDFFNDMPDKDMALGDWLNWWAIAPGPAGWNGPPLSPYPNFSCASGCTWPIQEPESQALRPFPQFSYINMDSYLQNLGQSTYNALEARLDRRFHNGLNIMASYTFSKTLTDADVIQPYWSTLQNGGAVQDPENLRAEKSVSSEDIPNNFVVSYLYELPVGRGKKFLATTPGPVSWVISNWEVTGVQHYESGQPMSIFGATGIPGKNSSVRFDRVAGQPAKNSGYMNPLTFKPGNTPTIPGDMYSTRSCLTGYFNCKAFYDPNLFQNRDPNGVGPTGQGNPWRFGTMPRNSADIRWVGYETEDFGIQKTIPIHDKVQIQFRGEMFDAFNRHIFSRPVSNLNITGANIGQIGGLQNGPRNVQFRLRINY